LRFGNRKSSRNFTVVACFSKDIPPLGDIAPVHPAGVGVVSQVDPDLSITQVAGRDRAVLCSCKFDGSAAKVSDIQPRQSNVLHPLVTGGSLEALIGRIEGLTEKLHQRRLPKELGKGVEPDRLYFATSRHWRGYFILSHDILWNPDDEERPYTLIFDAASWRDIEPIPVRKFRGFRYLENMPG
jgi:hypothetical protein